MELISKLIEYPEAAILFCALVYMVYSWRINASSESFFSFLLTIGKYGAIVGGCFLIFGVLYAFTPYGENQLGPFLGVLFYGPLGLLLGIMVGAIAWLLKTSKKESAR
ncbi:MAG: hypothetical protein P8179_23405 [Candidatus Thiodiazotropha sp.]